MLLKGEITEEEYRYKKFVYIETMLELYIKGIITKEQMQEKLNQQSTIGQLKLHRLKYGGALFIVYIMHNYFVNVWLLCQL